MKTETFTQCPRQFSRLATALLGLLIMQMTGCEAPSPTSVPEGSAAMKQQALSFTPPPGKAGVYVIRVDGGPNVHVSLDYQEFGSLQAKSYLFGLVASGKHALGPSDINLLDSGSLAVRFTAESGKNYYFKATGSGNSNPVDVHVVPISETNCQAYVREFKLSGENRFELQNSPGQAQ